MSRSMAGKMGAPRSLNIIYTHWIKKGPSLLNVNKKTLKKKKKKEIKTNIPCLTSKESAEYSPSMN